MKKIVEALSGADKVLFLCHVSPDGDTLGSAAALALALQARGKQTAVYTDKPLPHKYSFLKEYTRFVCGSEVSAEDFDCLAAVDTAGANRLGSMQEPFLNSESVTLNIDHHVTNPLYADYNLVEQRPACAEVAAKVIKQLGVSLTKEIAECLYIALCTDTGRFSYLGTDEDSFKLAAHLVEAGADIPRLCNLIYATRSYAATKLLAFMLDGISLEADGKIALLSIDLKDLSALGALPEDCEELIDYGREIEGVEIAIFLRQMEEGKYKASLRSKYYADVAKIAVFFGGGGHTRAAGCMFTGSLEEIKKTIVAAAERELEQYERDC